MVWAGLVARMEKRRGINSVLVGMPENRRPNGIPGRRWEDIVKMDLQEVGCGGMDLNDLVQDRNRWHIITDWFRIY